MCFIHVACSRQNQIAVRVECVGRNLDTVCVLSRNKRWPGTNSLRPYVCASSKEADAWLNIPKEFLNNCTDGTNMHICIPLQAYSNQAVNVRNCSGRYLLHFISNEHMSFPHSLWPWFAGRKTETSLYHFKTKYYRVIVQYKCLWCRGLWRLLLWKRRNSLGPRGFTAAFERAFVGETH